jgi:hypothetical protein
MGGAPLASARAARQKAPAATGTATFASARTFVL